MQPQPLGQLDFRHSAPTPIPRRRRPIRDLTFEVQWHSRRASPINQNPIPFGIDVVIHSGTKYLNGHSDIVGGAIIGRAALVSKCLLALDILGGSMDPHACFLLHRGLKTLALRVRFQNGSALRVARVLQSHPAVAGVNYPGLPDHPAHADAARLFDGFGGMLSFELQGGEAAAKSFMSRVGAFRI